MPGHSTSKMGVNALMPGHPDREGTSLSGMPGTRPGMTQRYVWNGRMATTGRLLLAPAPRPLVGPAGRGAGHHARGVGAILGAAVDVGVHAGRRDGQPLERLRRETLLLRLPASLFTRHTLRGRLR